MSSDRDRRNLGRPLGDEILRRRLIDTLAERWVVRLVTVEAPGGFGKSTALAQSIRDNDDDPSGLDVYVRCRPSMRSIEDLTDAVLTEIGATVPRHDAVPGATAVAAAVVALSPVEVCLCLDDVHVLADMEGVAEFVTGLLDDLPFHGHVVLSGRSLPDLKIARLRAADQVIELAADDLVFDDDELASIAALHDVPVDELSSTGGWPALTRLSVTAEHSAPADFLIEEIIDAMSGDHRRALGVAVIAGVATDALLEACEVDARSAEMLGSTPLLTDFGGGDFGAHDLWHEMIEHVLDHDARGEIAAEVLAHLSRVGSHRDAVDTAIRHELWPLALDEMMAVFVDLDVAVDLATVDRWLSALPGDVEQEPAFQFLLGTRDRMAGDIAGSADAIRRAAEGFQARGDLDGETTAVLEMGLRSWLLDDSELWAEMWDRSVRIVADGGKRMATTSAIGRVVTAERSGDFVGALREYETLPELGDIELGHAATLAMLVGEPTKAIAFLDEQMERFPKPAVEGLLTSTHWQAGDPSRVEAGGYTSHRLDNSRDVLLGVFIEAMVRTNYGLEADAARVEELAWDRSREQTFVALAHAARALIDSDEATASTEFEQRLSSIGFDEPLLRGELRRYLLYSYVLSPTAREWLETGEGFGPLHHSLRDLARTFVAARANPSAPIGALPQNTSLLTWLPLPWSVELAARLASLGDVRGRELVDYLADAAGAAVHRELRRVVVRYPEVASGVESILAAVPAPPREVTRLSLCGPVAVSVGDGASVPVTRQRVRQVLCLLSLDDRWTRQSIQAALWPGLDEARASANLRSTLRHVRRLLEPERPPGEATFHVRQRDDRVWLQRSDLLDIDVWTVERHLAAATELVEVGEVERANEAQVAAVDLWSGGALDPVRDVDAALPAVVDLERRVASAGCSAAERLLSQTRFGESVQLARRLLSWDPLLERAHDVVIGAHLAAGNLAEAERAIEACMAVLNESGLAPSSGTEMLVRRFERRSGRTAPGRSA